MKKTISVGLLSGGIDSSVAATICKNRGDELYLLSINYDQVMQRELRSTQALAQHIGAKEHRTIVIHGFKEISHSARTHEALIEYNRPGALAQGYVPSAYPPGRDFTFISMGAAWAETLVLAVPERYDTAKIIIGTNFTDSLDYPDCQKDVYEMFTALLNSSLKMSRVLGKRIEVEAPLIDLTKQQVIALAHKLRVPLELTWSCYSGRDKACGRCDACRIRFFGFENSGLHDPVEYETTDISPLDVGEPASVRV